MSTNKYYPDNWVVISVGGNNPHYRIMAGWGGGYTQGTSWRINSGISSVKLIESNYHFYGDSGSCYVCHKDYYRISSSMPLSLCREQKIEILDDQNWLEKDWKK